MTDLNAEFLKQRYGGSAADPNAAFLQARFGGGTVSAPPPGTVKSIADSLAYGFENTGMVMLMRGKGPNQQMPDDAPWYYRAAAGVGGLAGDFLPGVAGAVAGTAGGPVGQMAGGFALPMALREGVVEAYNGGHALDFNGVLEIGKAALKGGAKGAIIGAATGGAGKALAPVLGQSVKGAVALTAAEVGVMTTVSSTLEGRVPSWQDFMDNAILLGGVKAAVGTAKTLRNVWAQTGKLPEEVRADAAKDPTLAQELMGPPDPNKLPAAYEPLALEQRVQAALDKDPRPEAVRKILTDPNWKPTADDPPPVRTEYITDRESLAGIYGEVGRVYAKDIEFARRGERSNAATMVDAYNMVFGGKLEPHKIGAAENAETIAGRLIVAKSALLRAEQAVAAVKADPLNKAAQLDFYATMELLANVQKDARAAVAEWGRAGQIQRAIKRDPAMLVDAEALLAHVEKTQKAPFGEIVAMFDKLRDPANKMAFAEKAMESGGLAKIVEVWRAGIFSGPLTWEANILGNVGKWATDVVERPIAALIEAGMSKTPLKASQVKARAFAPLYGLEMAVLDGLKFFSETADLVKSQGWGAAGKRLNQVIEGQGDKIDVLRSANDPNSANPLERGAAGFSKFSFGALKLQDIPFRTIGERMEAYKLAVDRVARETDYHPSTTEWKQAVMRYVNEPTLGLTAEGGLAVTKAIEAAGDAQVFSQPLGKRASMASAAISGTPWEFLFPARRTPINLLDWAVQHTPGANFLSSRWRADFQAGGERQAQALARVVVGTSLAATAYGLTQSGLLTGGGLADKDMNATKEGARVPNYALKVGDTYYSVARIEPVAKLFMLAGDLAEIAKSPKLTEEDRGKAISMMVLAFANATVSTTYLSGLANAMKAVTDPERYGQSLVEGYATSVVPKVVGQPTTMADPYKREVDGVIEAIQSQIPFLREQLVAKRDVWGQKVENERLFGVMPIGTSKAAEEKVKTEAMRLYLGLARAPEYVMERGPLKPTDKRTKLSHEQRDVLQEVSGKFAMQELSRVVSSPDWDRLPAFAQIKVYKDVMESATKIGTVAALPPDAPERVARRQKILQAIIRQSQEAESR